MYLPSRHLHPSKPYHREHTRLTFFLLYRLMGAMTNNSRKLANFSGFYKGIQSAGAAIIWRLDALKISYTSEYASSWGLCAAGLLIAAPAVWFKVKDHVSIEDDLKFSDETVDDVAPTAEIGGAPEISRSEKA